MTDPAPSSSPSEPVPASGTQAGKMTNGDSNQLPSRTLVLCFDGTTNQFDGENTNVVKLYALFKKDDNEQLCYYQPGIGTYLQPGVVSPLFEWAAKIMDEGIAWFLDAHVRGGYTFLMQNWRPGDKICLFGFSRGAYTARALAGMLHKIGLLPRDSPEQLPFAYKLFKNTDPASLVLAAGFKETFCRSVKIEFVGVWDTVASVGILMGRTLPFTTSNTTIKTFRHALSLDEHRAKFLPNLYHRSGPEPGPPVTSPNGKKLFNPGQWTTPGVAKLRQRHQVKPPSSPKKAARKWTKLRRDSVTNGIHENEKHPKKGDLELADLADVSEKEICPDVELNDTDEIEGGTDILEVWFPGCHSDIGGGAVVDGTKFCLSDISLHWMVREIVRSQCGIQLDQAALARENISDSVFTGVGFPLTPPALSMHKKLVKPRVCDEDVDIDALQPLHDELKTNLLWWILEIVPTSYTWQDASGKWHVKWGFHLGKGRRIPDIRPNFHNTVKERMENAALKYVPRAVWNKGTEVYVS